MTRDEAYTKWKRLAFMTVERGCFPGEAANAKTMRDRLGKMWGFEDAPPRPKDGNDFARRTWEEYVRRSQARPQPKPSRREQHDWSQEYERARREFKWEERHCGKSNCWCASSKDGHGPYKYSKVRKGRRVYSIYVGGAARPHRGSKHA